MARDEKRRQQSLQRKAAKRKQHRTALAPADRPPTSARGVAKRAAHWPLLEVLVTANWATVGEIVQVYIAREAPTGEVGVASFLVDLACLGVKDSYVTLAPTRAEYESGVRAAAFGRQDMRVAALADVARLVTEAVDYAQQFGFVPRGEFQAAMSFLGGVDPAASDWQVPLGREGKPYFIAGPHDNVPAILAKLDRAVGPGNYDFLIGAPIPLSRFDVGEGDFEDDEGEDDDFDDDEDREADLPPPPQATPRPWWRRLGI